MANADEVRCYARRVAYLGSVEKIMVALRNEFGAGHRMPSRAAIEALLDERSRKGSLRKVRHVA